MRIGIIITTIYLTISLGLYAQELNKATSFFSKIPQDLYLGAVLSKKSLNTEKHELKDIKNTHKMSVWSPTLKYEYPEIIPSKENMYKIITDEFKAKGEPTGGTGIASYSLSSVKNFEDLNILFGQKMDLSKWFGINPESKFPKANILISYEIPLFEIYLDISNENLFKFREELKALKDDDLIYVSALIFGRKALILVQSDFDEKKLIVTLNSYLNDEELTEEEKIILETATISYNIFEDVPLNLDNPNPIKSIKNYLTAPITVNNFGGIIKFIADNINGTTYQNSY